jgi:hypothetical protein
MNAIRLASILLNGMPFKEPEAMNRRFKFRMIGMILIACICGSQMPAAEPATRNSDATHNQQPESGKPESIKQRRPSFLVRVDVDRPSRVYKQNDQLSVKVVSEVDAYGYVLYRQADGKVYQIFPNSIQRDNRLHARQTVAIPGGDDLFRWRIAPPFGRETVKFIAS